MRNRMAVTIGTLRAHVSSALLAVFTLAFLLAAMPAPAAADATRAVTVRVVTADGRPVRTPVGWESGDARASKCKMTDQNGEATWLAMPVREVTFHSGNFLDCDSYNSRWINTLRMGDFDFSGTVPPSGPMIINVGPVPEIVSVRIVVQMPDGTPVPGAKVFPGNGAGPGAYHVGSMGGPAYWLACPPEDAGCEHGYHESMKTDYVGTLSHWRFEPKVPYRWAYQSQETPCYRITYDDGELWQETSVECGDTQRIDVELPYMPVVRVEAPPVDAVLLGSEVQVTATAVDGSGDPIADQELAISTATVSSVPALGPASACTPRLKGTTGSMGRVRFILCADRTMRWRADGVGLVASRAFSVLVRRPGSPGKPREVHARYRDDGTVVMVWRTPKSTGSSAIKRYQYRWSRDRGFTWTRWKSTGLTRRAPGRQVAAGKTYLFQVRAVNEKGGGATGTRYVSAPT